MSLQTAGLCAKVGFIIGCAAGLSLAVAEFAAWATSGSPALVRPFEGLAILTVVLMILGPTCAMLGIWLARRQDQIMEMLARDDDPDPARAHPRLKIAGLSPESIEVARRISARLDHAA